MSGASRPAVYAKLTTTQARILQGVARRAMATCGDGERPTWEGAYRALGKAIREMRRTSAAANKEVRNEAE